MNTALIYRPNNRKLSWIAFACAITIHLGAIALAGNKTKPATITWGGEPDNPIIGTDSQEPPEIEFVLPSQPTVGENQDFPDENVTQPPIRPQRRMPVTTIPRATGIGTARTMSSGSVKALTLYAPKPTYPYEARRTGTLGTGVAQLRVNSAAGNVIDARMAQSTGSAILDNATLEALKRWRFKPGVAENVDVPITYTLAGVSY
jgi:TonB family protein